MSISSIGNNWALYLNLYKTTGTAGNQQVSQDYSQSSVNSIGGVSASTDGDIFVMNGTQIGSSYSLYGPPPPPPSGQTDSFGNDPVKSFLDKVAAGTATTEDLENMTSLLQNFSAGASTATSSATDSQSSDPIKRFLDKVAAGTATSSDLSSMQEILQNLKAENSAPPPPPLSGQGDSDPIRSFLDKVAAGTATTEDLENMTSLLQNFSAGASTATSSATDSQTSDPIKSFLDKVAAGTVTSSDLSVMQSILLQLQNQFA